MWNVMLKIPDYFLCVSSRHDLGYLGPVFPNYPNTQIHAKQVYITQPLDGLDTRVKANLMGNVELKTFDYF